MTRLPALRSSFLYLIRVLLPRGKGIISFASFMTLTLFLLAPLSKADSLAQLNFDPFRMPNFAQQHDEHNPGVTSPASPWNPRLRATMVAGKNSMANVNGSIVKLGESIQGHTLLEVQERAAIFTKDGNQIKLTLEEGKPYP